MFSAQRFWQIIDPVSSNAKPPKDRTLPNAENPSMVDYVKSQELVKRLPVAHAALEKLRIYREGIVGEPDKVRNLLERPLWEMKVALEHPQTGEKVTVPVFTTAEKAKLQLAAAGNILHDRLKPDDLLPRIEEILNNIVSKGEEVQKTIGAVRADGLAARRANAARVCASGGRLPVVPEKLEATISEQEVPQYIIDFLTEFSPKLPRPIPEIGDARREAVDTLAAEIYARISKQVDFTGANKKHSTAEIRDEEMAQRGYAVEIALFVLAHGEIERVLREDLTTDNSGASTLVTDVIVQDRNRPGGGNASPQKLDLMGVASSATKRFLASKRLGRDDLINDRENLGALVKNVTDALEAVPLAGMHDPDFKTLEFISADILARHLLSKYILVDQPDINSTTSAALKMNSAGGGMPDRFVDAVNLYYRSHEFNGDKDLKSLASIIRVENKKICQAKSEELGQTITPTMEESEALATAKALQDAYRQRVKKGNEGYDQDPFTKSDARLDKAGTSVVGGQSEIPQGSPTAVASTTASAGDIIMTLKRNGWKVGDVDMVALVADGMRKGRIQLHHRDRIGLICGAVLDKHVEGFQQLPRLDSSLIIEDFVDRVVASAPKPSPGPRRKA